MARGVDQVLLAAEHMGHAHERVVHDDREVVGRGAVALADDEVVELLGLEAHLAQDLVVDDDRVVGHAEADHMVVAPRQTRQALLARDLERGAVVAVPGLVPDRLLALGVELLDALESGVRAVGLQERVDGGVVAVEAPGLVERADPAIVAADAGAVVVVLGAVIPVDPEPGEVFEDAPGGGFGGAFEVGVLDAEDEASAVSPGVGPAQQGGARAADVEVPRGGGGEACHRGGRARIGHGEGLYGRARAGRRPRVEKTSDPRACSLGCGSPRAARRAATHPAGTPARARSGPTRPPRCFERRQPCVQLQTSGTSRSSGRRAQARPS